jgi:hypothetical protein
VTVDGTTESGRDESGEGDEANGEHASANPSTPPPPEVATREPESAGSMADEEVMLTAGETISIRNRWGLSLTLGAGALVDPQRDAVALASLRVAHGLTPKLAFGVDLTVLASPGADRDRLAVALMGALLRGGLLDGRLTLDLSVGPELASDPGLGYQVGARFGRRIGFVLRWDGAVLAGDNGAFHRASATAGLSLDF